MIQRLMNLFISDGDNDKKGQNRQANMHNCADRKALPGRFMNRSVENALRRDAAHPYPNISNYSASSLMTQNWLLVILINFNSGGARSALRALEI